MDGIAERVSLGQRRVLLLVACGIASQGCKALFGLPAGAKKGHETVSAFIQDYGNRDLDEWLPIISNDAAGVIKAIEICFPPPSL